MLVECGPKHLDKRKLYGLKEGEEVLFSQFRPTSGTLFKRISPKKVEGDMELRDLHKEVLAIAKRMEEGSILEESGGMDIEMQGYFKDIRVVPAKHPITGHTVRGFTLVGTPR